MGGSPLWKDNSRRFFLKMPMKMTGLTPELDLLDRGEVWWLRSLATSVRVLSA